MSVGAGKAWRGLQLREELRMDRKQYIDKTLGYLKDHLEHFPDARAQDIVKFVFQGLLGTGHILGASEDVEAYIFRESANLTADPGEPLLERVSPSWCRLNLRRALAEGLTPRNIAQLMLTERTQDGFSRQDVERVCRAYGEEHHLSGMPEILGQLADEHWLPSHSEEYRALYHPAYRLISARWEPLLPAVCAVVRKAGAGQRVLITLDGPCASGKTTLAGKLGAVLDAAVLHTDDFVVPHAKKTPARLAQPGGNCDWERLVSEVIAPWKAGQTGTYRRYDCHLDCLTSPEPLPAGNILILEGSYSNLPAIRAYADVRVFAATPEAIRWERLKDRESPASLKMFWTRWIPLENAYFEAYGLPDEGMILTDGYH